MGNGLDNLRRNFARLSLWLKADVIANRVAWKRVTYEMIHGTPMPQSKWGLLMRQYMAGSAVP